MKRCDRLCVSAEFIERALLAWPFRRRTSIVNLLRMETMGACSILLGQLHETPTSTKELRGLSAQVIPIARRYRREAVAREGEASTTLRVVAALLEK
jgi:hypothetical protein